MKKLVKFGKSFGLGRLVCLVLLAGFVALRVWDPGPLEALRMRSFDFYQRLRPRLVTIRPVVIVDIDEQSLAKFGQWPWPRTLLADLISKLTQAGSAAIGMDILFAEPDRMSPAIAAESFRGLNNETRQSLAALPDNDEVFAEAIRRGRVVLGESGDFRPHPEVAGAPPPAAFATIGLDPSPFLITFPGLIRNIPVLEKAAAGRGLLNIRPEADGIVRRVPLVLKAQDQLIPTYTLDMLRLVTGAGGILVRTNAAGIESVAVPGLRIPTDRHAQMWINFSHYDPNRYVSVADVLDGRVPADRFNRRLVLLGTSAIGLRDIKTTPTDPAMSGVEVHAQVIENILSGSFLIYPNYAIGAEILAAALTALIAIAVGPMLGAASILAMGAVLAASIAGGSWYLFTQQRLLLDASYPLLCATSIYFTLIFINYFREQMQRRRIRSAFGQYLAPSLVDQLAQSPERLVLGGEVRSMTIMFTDVRGFTTISETFKDDPQGLTSLMNSFLTPMTNSIVDHKGTIDKYIGDAIMAFWNAPLHDPDHEMNACRTALDLLRRVDALNQSRQATDAAAGRPFIPLKMGIGLNTGPCVVGNMGSDLRFNYSVLGDPVNLASRLEGQTKNYRVPIIIGSRTAAAVSGKLAVLELDRITVKGKTEPESVFTLLGMEDAAAGEAFRQMTSAMEEFFRFYRAMDLGAAEKSLQRCREAGRSFPLNDFFDVYEDRLKLFRRAPPPADWNGVMVLETK